MDSLMEANLLTIARDMIFGLEMRVFLQPEILEVSEHVTNALGPCNIHFSRLFILGVLFSASIFSDFMSDVTPLSQDCLTLKYSWKNSRSI